MMKWWFNVGSSMPVSTCCCLLWLYHTSMYTRQHADIYKPSAALRTTVRQLKNVENYSKATEEHWELQYDNWRTLELQYCNWRTLGTTVWRLKNVGNYSMTTEEHWELQYDNWRTLELQYGNWRTLGTTVWRLKNIGNYSMTTEEH